MILEKAMPFAVAFFGALAATLVLTPIVREINRSLGMVDKPDPRRINKVPIPRGGGIALVLGVFVPYSVFVLVSGRPGLLASGAPPSVYWKLVALSAAIAALGYADDKFSLNPKVKLAGQIVVAALAWAWAGLGFSRLWPSLPAWLDCAMTTFWIIGAVNAFNLIDGLDGLASGLALIATLGMAGSLFLLETPTYALFYFAFAGGLVGFLRYNYNPASVFLGDSGSMFIGFTIAVLPLVSQAPNSFLVSVGVPLLAMGVPIFDTALAILRRSIRSILHTRDDSEKGNGKVMTADSDHIHHRILRATGFNQRKAAWILYAIAVFFVATGLVGMVLRSRAGGLWLFAVAVASVVVFKDMSRIELFDAGRLLNSVVRDRGTRNRRRLAKLNVPLHIAADIAALISVWFLCAWALRMPLSRAMLRVGLPLQVISTFLCLVLFGTYRTAWSRAMISNYVRLFFACAFGAAAALFVVYYTPVHFHGHTKAMALAYATSSYVGVLVVRIARGVIRDFFYALDCTRLKSRKDVSRVLVYGAGLRYRSFRRELVRTASANNRIIVGLIDDDILLRGQYIGGLQVLGTLAQAPDIIKEVNADAVVVACVVSDAWMKVIREMLAPTGVRITQFRFVEEQIEP